MLRAAPNSTKGARALRIKLNLTILTIRMLNSLNYPTFRPYTNQNKISAPAAKSECRRQH